MKKILTLIFICLLISCVNKKQLLNKNIPSGRYSIYSILLPNKNTLYSVHYDKRGNITTVESFKPNNGVEEFYNYTIYQVPTYTIRFEKIKYRKKKVKAVISIMGDTILHTNYTIIAKKRIHFNLSTDSNNIQTHWNNYFNSVAFFPNKYVHSIHKAINIENGKLFLSNDTLIFIL